MTRIRLSDASADLTEKAQHAQDRYINACREVLLGNPYEGDWLDALQVAMDNAHADMRASWVTVDG